MNKLDQNIWNDFLGKKLLLAAMSLALITHGVILYFTLPNTYDAYVHMFFADHYSRFWFEPFEYRWYTGFLTTSYPPLVHQMVALLSKVFPLKVAFTIYAVLIFEVLIMGIYRFSKLFGNKTIAGVAALLAVVLSSIIETLHVYGQAPTLTGLAFLLNALPFLHQYIIRRKVIYLLMTLASLAVAISAHHVTAIFGMVFFIAPVIFMALVDTSRPEDLPKNFIGFLIYIIRKAFTRFKEIALFGIFMISMALGLIFPYWHWSKTDPITQVSIPHGSRDNFLEVTSSGLIFYVIPLALIVALLPAISYSITRQKRYIGWAVSFFLCLLLGSGGTTPIPKLMLGENAFNILTLDRFSFWGSIIAIPFMARFIYSFLAGPVRNLWLNRFKASTHFIISGLSGFTYILFIVYIFHLASFRPLQPKEVNIQPILNFLNRDDHMRWRYLTLGFGDQMAWLSANTLAATVDGNYHSARRLPEMTSRPVERLENAKYLGDAGLATLNDFLTKAEKYKLKYIFSNDQYYDPLLYYTGWNRTVRLENNIMVWEKGNISTIQPIQPKEMNPLMKKAWGIIPVSSLILAISLSLFYMARYKQKEYFDDIPDADGNYPRIIAWTTSVLPILFFSFLMSYQIHELLLVNQQKTPETTVLNYYNELDFQRFESAFRFFKPSPAYTLDQYLLEKSVNDGGLLPSYAKLDSISTNTIIQQTDTTLVETYTRWRTSVGFRHQHETLTLVKDQNNWYILPPELTIQIPEEQVLSHTYTIFKRVGKRHISSYPVVKDDRVNRPVIKLNQANFYQSNTANYIVGELVNADNIPANIALSIQVHFRNAESRTYYPGKEFMYNLSPKAQTYFKVQLDSTHITDTLNIERINIEIVSDATDKGYLHGGTIAYETNTVNSNEVELEIEIQNELTTDISIPGVLIAEKSPEGNIQDVKLVMFDKAIRSGLSRSFKHTFNRTAHESIHITQYPIEVLINGKTSAVSTNVPDAINPQELVLLPHCFMSKAIYLQ